MFKIYAINDDDDDWSIHTCLVYLLKAVCFCVIVKVLVG